MLSLYYNQICTPPGRYALNRQVHDKRPYHGSNFRLYGQTEAYIGMTSASAILAWGDLLNLSKPHRLMCKLRVKTVSTSKNCCKN